MTQEMTGNTGRSSAISTEIDGPVLTVTLSRPDVRNAVDRPTAEALAATFAEFNRADGLSVAVFQGAGATFCAGADLGAVSEGGARANRVVMPAGKGDAQAPDASGPMGPSRMVLSKPVIAAIEGHAVAGGMELALWCDLRVMAEDAVMGVFCRRWGVPLIDGGTVRLPRLIGQSRALDLILTGRPVGADEALAMGLTNRVAPKGEALSVAQALAQDIAKFPQTCLRSDRQSAYEQWDLQFGEAMANETKLGLETIRSGETRAGATRFKQGHGRGGRFDDI